MTFLFTLSFPWILYSTSVVTSHVGHYNHLCLCHFHLLGGTWTFFSEPDPLSDPRSLTVSGAAQNSYTATSVIFIYFIIPAYWKAIWSYCNLVTVVVSYVIALWFLLLSPVYTIQPVVKPVVIPVWQPVECLYTRYNRLSNWLSNQFGNQLYRAYKHSTSCQTHATGCIMYTAGCQTSCTMGLTTGCIV